MNASASLPDETLLFAKRIGDSWIQPEGMSMVDFQQRFLYAHALGAARTAKSYWILREEEQEFDAQVLARGLLERIFSARVAQLDPRYGVEIIAYEIQDRIDHQNKWIKSHGDPCGGKQQHLDHLQSELDQFLTLLGLSKAPKWDRCRRAEKAGILWAYRSAFSEFSRFVHTGYDATAFEDECEMNVSDFVALVAPIDTALWLDHCANGGSAANDETYKDLFTRIELHCWGDPDIK